MMKRLLLSACCLFGVIASAANVSVSVDEDGVIQPQPARDAIARAVSATVMIDLAAAKVEILTNVAGIAVRTMEEANELLNKRGDFAIMSFTATGVKDAVKQGGESVSDGEIRIVDCSYDDRTDPDNVLATLTWQYSLGKFTEPKCLGTANLQTTNVWDRIEMTAPVQIEWGTKVAYRATASIPKSMADGKFFLRIDAKPDAPIDDGQVFDIFSDGTDYTIRFEPSHVYEIRIISGRITNVRLIQ